LGALDRAVYNDEISPFPAGKGGLRLYINLSYPDNEIKDQVMAWVAKFREQIKKPKSWVWDKLPLYHQAISLKMSGKTANEIADSVPRRCTGDEGLVPRSRFAGAGSKAPQAASVKSRGGKR
jgi:hypothetical protein